MYKEKLLISHIAGTKKTKGGFIIMTDEDFEADLKKLRTTLPPDQVAVLERTLKQQKDLRLHGRIDVSSIGQIISFVEAVTEGCRQSGSVVKDKQDQPIKDKDGNLIPVLDKGDMILGMIYSLLFRMNKSLDFLADYQSKLLTELIIISSNSNKEDA